MKAMTQNDFDDVLTYIRDYWEKDSENQSRWRPSNLRNAVMRLGHIRLPYPSVPPNVRYFAGAQFYWDSYFTIIGLVVDGQATLARQMVDNLCHLHAKFGLIPARNSWTSLGRSQPPYLTRMAFEVYEHGGADMDWLTTVMKLAEREYQGVWMSAPRYIPELGLSRYQPRYFSKSLAVYESGWDKSSRYQDKDDGRSLIPVDLNALLYMYESDFADFAGLRHDKAAQAKWQEAMARRKRSMDKYLWDRDTGFYLDYDYRTHRSKPLKTLAGFTPLWAGAAGKVQATRCKRHLPVFQQAHGLSATEKVSWRGWQWDYPNGWPPLVYMTCVGLKRYGFMEEATAAATTWLRLNQKIFERTGTLWEKYDVVRGDIGRDGRYPTQAGFAWTNAVFARLCHELL